MVAVSDTRRCVDVLSEVQEEFVMAPATILNLSHAVNS